MLSQDRVIKIVKDTILTHQMVAPGDRLVVGVSGGPDSVCLLHILYQLKEAFGMALVVAHFNHGLRPHEDQAETRFVESLSQSLSLPFECGEAPGDLHSDSGSLEEAAREARYGFLREIKRKFKAQKIAVGHTRDDQAETVLMRLLRGSGPAGLSGIPPVRREGIIRPLIELDRQSVETYLKSRGLKSMKDSSNLEARYLRNRIRGELIPLIKKYQPRVVEILAQTADIMRHDEALLEEEARAWITKECGKGENERPEVSLSLFIDLPQALRGRVVRELLRMAGGTLRRVTRRHIQAVIRLAEGEKAQSRIHLPNQVMAEKIYGRLVFSSPGMENHVDFSYLLKGPGTYPLEALNGKIVIEEMDRGDVKEMERIPWTAFLNGDRISFPLAIRNFRKGDRFVPIGMAGHKKVKDLFIDIKLPSHARVRIPILTLDNEPIWICGIRIDDRFKVGEDTKKILKITLESESLARILSGAWEKR